jgi:fermentation-respiration switch protein FrsA (DUF1100 family)
VKGGVPCVVLAHGFTGVRDMQLQRPAERFVSEGFGALVFDYRHFGDSGGDPRQVLNIADQYEDWDAAIAFAEQLEWVDRARIALWGTSFCGGHVIDAAVRHPEVAAVIAQAPFVDGLSQILRTPPRIGLRLAFDGIQDELRRRRGRPRCSSPSRRRPGVTWCCERAARRSRRAELRRYGGLHHFDVYVGEGFERLVADQLAFLRSHV